MDRSPSLLALFLVSLTACGAPDVHRATAGDAGPRARDAGRSPTSDAGPMRGECTPGHATCASGIAEVCTSEGHLLHYACDPVQGLACTPAGCVGACDPYSLSGSYVGCDYAPTVTINPVWSSFHFAVAVASTSDEETHVQVTRADATVATETVAPHGTAVIQLPWVPELKGGDFDSVDGNAPDPGDTRLVQSGAYHLRTDQPVTVYQFSPYEYTLGPISSSCPYFQDIGDCASFSNDASLLLPRNALGRSYTVASWASGGDGATLYAVTAMEDGTEVTITGRGTVRAGDGIDAAGDGTVTLDAGDVLEVIGTPAPTTTSGPQPYGTDLTATRITATKPVQVIGGNGCANVPTGDTGFCDHMEEVLFPDATLDADYVVTLPNGATASDQRSQVLRVIAPTPGTTVHFDPAVAADALLDAASPFIDVVVTADVHITADHPVVVAQYMVGSDVGEPGVEIAQGDPSESLAVPTSRFRRDYQFFASRTYATSFVNVVAPLGATVTLDGRVLPASDFTAVGGAGGFGVAHEALGMSSEVHQLTGDVPVGITVYGYAPYTSFMYPGGLDVVVDLI